MDKPKKVTKSVENMIFKEKIVLLDTVTKVGNTEVLKVTIKDYRQKDNPAYSVLTMEFEYEDNIEEWKYDYGVADKSLQSIVDLIIGSSGQKVDVDGKVITLLTPPSLMEILETYVAMREMNTGPR